MGLGSFFKNLFGSKKVDQVVDQVEEFAENAIDKAKEVAAPLIDKAEVFIDQAEAKVKEYTPQASEAIGNVVNTIKEKAEDLMGKNQDVAPVVDYVPEEKVVNFAEETPEKIVSFADVTPEKAADEVAD